MHVGDALGVLGDDVEVVAVAVGDMPGVEAQVHELRIGVLQEPLDPVLGVDVGVDVRVEHELDAVLLEQDPAQRVGALDEVAPLLGRDLAGPRRPSAVQVGVLLGQLDQVLGPDLAQQPGLLREGRDRLVERLLPAVQAGEDGAAADGQAAAAQLLAQPVRVLRQEAGGPEFGVDVADARDLVEIGLPGHLVRIAREPDAPGVGGGAEAQRAQGAHVCSFDASVGGLAAGDVQRDPGDLARRIRSEEEHALRDVLGLLHALHGDARAPLGE